CLHSTILASYTQLSPSSCSIEAAFECQHEGKVTNLEIMKQYASLAKPGVLFGNVITGVAGFCLASAWLRQFDIVLFVAAIGGMTLIIASACTLNNVLDQDIDRIMIRTKKRVVASGVVPARRALAFSI